MRLESDEGSWTEGKIKPTGTAETICYRRLDEKSLASQLSKTFVK